MQNPLQQVYNNLLEESSNVYVASPLFPAAPAPTPSTRIEDTISGI